MKLLLLALPLALLSACAGTPSTPNASTSPAPAATAGALDTAQLTANHWTLVAATDASGAPVKALFAQADQPVVLNFDQGRLSARAACNTLMGGYSVRGNQLHVGQMASSMIGCPPPLHDQDRAFGDLIEATTTLQTLDASTLVLRAANGTVLRFDAQPTAETRYGGPGQTVFMEVAPHTKPCHHPLIADMQCLQVRTLTYDASGIKQGTPGPFTAFYGQIEGYTHQPGVRNVLRLKRFELKNPPADGPSQAFVHDMTVETERVDR